MCTPEKYYYFKLINIKQHSLIFEDETANEIQCQPLCQHVVKYSI